jgi:hypothetical protein
MADRPKKKNATSDNFNADRPNGKAPKKRPKITPVKYTPEEKAERAAKHAAFRLEERKRKEKAAAERADRELRQAEAAKKMAASREAAAKLAKSTVR